MVRLPGEICALLTLLIVDLPSSTRTIFEWQQRGDLNWLEAMQTVQIGGSLSCSRQLS